MPPPFLCFSCPVAWPALQPTLPLRTYGGHLMPKAVVCSNIPNISWLALCELWALCYFLIAQTSLFFLLSTDSKRYEKIIKMLINGRGIFSVIKLAGWIEVPVCMCQEIQRCHHQTEWVREVLRVREGSQIPGLRVHRAMRINSSTFDFHTVIKVQNNTTLCPLSFYSANGALYPKLRLLFNFDVAFYISKVLYNPSLAILFSLYWHHPFHKLAESEKTMQFGLVTWILGMDFMY